MNNLRLFSLKKLTALMTAGLLLFASMPAAEMPAGAVTGNENRAVVTSTADAGPGSLRDAVAGVQDGGVIIFQIPGNGGKTIVLSSALTVEKTLTIDASTQGAAISLVLAADGYRHFVVNDTGAALTLKGLTLTGTGSSSFNGGLETTAPVTLEDCLVTNCYTDGSGGAVCAYGDASVTARYSAFSNNTASGTSGNGGAVFAESGAVTALNCTFSGNTADGGDGGAVCVYSGENAVTLRECVLIGNKANSGGAVNGSAVTAEGCTFRGNNANTGGAVSGGPVTLQNCSFTSNSSQSYGGAVYAVFNGTVDANNSFFTGNTAVGNGGAVYAATDISASGCTFLNNMATALGNGGGVYTVAGSVDVTGCSFTGNTAHGDMHGNGDGSAVSAPGGSVIAVNSTFAQNQALADTTGKVCSTVSAYTDIQMFHCTVAENTGVGVYAAIGQLFLYNSLLAGNTLRQAGKDMVGGQNLVAPDSTTDYFGGNVVTSGYLMPLPSVGNIKGAQKLTNLSSSGLDDATQQKILSALAYDQAGNARAGSAVTFGAVENTATTRTVTTESDNVSSPAAGSLRAVAAAAQADASAPDLRVIIFADNVKNIILAGSEIPFSARTLIYGRLAADGSPDVAVSSNSKSRAFHATGTSAGLWLYGLRCQEGAAGNGNGGAILIESGSVNAEHCVFDANTAAAGGGIYAQGSVRLMSCAMTVNSAKTAGAVYAGGNLIAANTSLLGNSTQNASGAASGAAVYFFHCTVADNQGGGVNAAAGGMYFYNSAVAGNTGTQVNTAPAGGSSLIEDIGNVTRIKVFGVNQVQAGGLSVLGNGIASGKAAALQTLSVTGLAADDVNRVLAALSFDQNGQGRSVNGAVTYGALETSEDKIVLVSASITRPAGETLQPTAAEQLSLLFGSGAAGSVSLADSDISLDTSTFHPAPATLAPQLLHVGFLGAAGILTVTQTQLTPSVTLSVRRSGQDTKAAVLTASVSGPQAIPLGEGTQVTFTDNGTVVGTTATDASGTALLTTQALTDGTHSFTASFAGNVWYTAAESAPITFIPNMQDQSISILGGDIIKTYGDVSCALPQVQKTGVGTVSFASADPTVAAVKDGNLIIGRAGTTTLTASIAAAEGYNPAVSVPITVTVQKKLLTVTADNKTRVYKSENPSFTVSFSGFVNGENKNVLKTLPVAACEADTDSPAGTYDIIPADGQADNYSFQYIKGTLTISAVNRDALEALLEKAKGMLSTLQPNDIGGGNGQIPQDAVDALKAAVQNADSFDNNPQAGQPEADSAAAALQKAVDHFSAAWVAVDFSELNGVVSKAAGLQQSGFTEGSWGALQKAVAAGRLLAGAKGVTQAQAAVAAERIRAAMDGLMPATKQQSGQGKATNVNTGGGVPLAGAGALCMLLCAACVFLYPWRRKSRV